MCIAPIVSWAYSEIFALTGLPAINDVIRHRRIAVFSYIARLQDSTPAHKALQSHVNLSLGRLPHHSWSRRPGRLRGRWIDQIRNDTSQTPADLWRQALGRGHRRRATRLPTLTMRWWWWWWWIDEFVNAGMVYNLVLCLLVLFRPHKV